MSTIATPEKIDAKAVKAKVTDWIARLKKLYSNLDDWVQDYPNAAVTRGAIKQPIEYLMKQFHVAPRNIPTYTVTVDEKWRVRFIPRALWTVGANGQIDILTNIRPHTLADLGGQNGSPSDWQLVVADARKFLIPFDQAAFTHLLKERR
jgi:hypothetical protein